jgi:endonuclease/exonuclease/phosphatase family metal-dependent hydrolase
VFYVTNRDCPRAVPAGRDPCPAKTATQRNLIALGLPFAADPTSLLMRGERPQWVASSKSARRAWIGERYRIVALVGDDLNDFIDRREFMARRAELEPLFGTRWFLLPNPIYGSWERALSDPACTPAMASETCSAAKLARKYQLLEPQPAPLALPGGRAFDAQRRPARLRIASWNIEYLLEPDTYGALAAACIPAMTSVGGALRRIPCTIVPRLDRGPADFAALRAYAARLDADVVALQEVDGPAAAGQVFPGYEFCFSARPHVQRNGFAIRRGVPFRCEPEYLDLSLGDTQRRGVVVTLFPGTPGELTLMNVHLKSGCPAGPLNDETNKDCTTLSQQLPQLEGWIDAQAGAGRRFGVLGDFNRRVSLERGSARDDQGRPVNLWAELDDGEPAGADLLDVSAGQRFRKCVANDPYDSYVDLIVLGRALARDVVRGSFTRVTYSLEDAERYKLSDHCPVGIDLRLP